MGQASAADRKGFWRERAAGWKRSGVSLRIDSERHGLKAGTLAVARSWWELLAASLLPAKLA